MRPAKRPSPDAPARVGVAVLSPYHGGSHELFASVLRDVLLENQAGPTLAESDLHTYFMRPKKWGWKLRASALTYAQRCGSFDGARAVLVTSMVNLAELMALRPDLVSVPRKIYFMHENQLEFPKQASEEQRDYYFGHAQIVSCLAADVVVWNSSFNRDSFLKGVPKHFSSLPLPADEKPNSNEIVEAIRAKSLVYWLPARLVPSAPPAFEGPLRIAWPHRWEHDKDPQSFLRVLEELLKKDPDLAFTVHVYGGEAYEGVSAGERLAAVVGDARVGRCERLPSREDYLRDLESCDVCVSTAIHEFFGLAMVEAARLGLACWVPNRLSYVELFRSEARYNTENQLVKHLLNAARNPRALREKRRTGKHSDLLPGVWEELDLDGPSARARTLRMVYGAEAGSAASTVTHESRAEESHATV